MITGVPKRCSNLQQQPQYVFSQISTQGPSPTSAVFVRNPNCSPDSAIRRPTVRSLVLSEIFFPLEDVNAPKSVLRSKSACPSAPDRRSCVVLASRDNSKTTTCEEDLLRNHHRRPTPPMRSQKCYSQILTAPKSSKATASQRSKPPLHPLTCQSSFGVEAARVRTPDSDSIFHRLQNFLGLGKNPKLRKEKLPPCASSFGTVVPSPPNSFPEISRPADSSALPQIRSRSQSTFRSHRLQKPLSDIFHSRKSHQVATADANRQQLRRSDRKANQLPPSVSLCDAPCLQPHPPPLPARAGVGDLLTPPRSAILVPLIYTPFTSHQPTTTDCRPVYADPLQLSSFMPSNARPACRSRQHVAHQCRRRAMITDCSGAGEVAVVSAAVACCVSDVGRCNAELRQKHCSAHFVSEARKAPSQTSSGLWSASSSTSLGQPVGPTRRPTSAGQARTCRDSPSYSTTPSPFDPLENCRPARVPVGFADAQSQTSSEDSAVELHHCMQRSQSVATQSECEGSCENGSCYSSPPRLEALTAVASPQSPLPSVPTGTAVTPTAGIPHPIDVDKTPTQENAAVSTTPPTPAEPSQVPAARSGSTATLTGRGRHTAPSPCEADPRLPLESPLCVPNEHNEVGITATSSSEPEEIKLPPALEAKSYHYNPVDLAQRRARPQTHYQRQKSTNRDSLLFRNQCQQSPVFNDPTGSTFIFRNSPSDDQTGHRSPLNTDATDGNWWADILPYKPSTIPDSLADRLRHCSSLALSRVDLNAADTRSLASSVSRTDLSRRSLMTRSLFEPRAASPGARKDSDDDADEDNNQLAAPTITTTVAEGSLRPQPIGPQLLRQRSTRPRPVSYHDSCRAFTPAPVAQLPSLEHLSRGRRRLPKVPPAPTEPCNLQDLLNFTAVAVPPPCESPLLTPYCRLRVLRGNACTSTAAVATVPTDASTSVLRP
ncbi:hypothetical protein AAHC03_013747 [Spirometra sp. Aus1]